MKLRDKITDALTPWIIIAIFSTSGWIVYVAIVKLLNQIKNWL